TKLPSGRSTPKVSSIQPKSPARNQPERPGSIPLWLSWTSYDRGAYAMSDPDVPSSPPPPQPPVDPVIAHGIYSTGLIVIHTRDEFMLDFLSGLDVPKLVGRVLATPAHAKRMVRALMENLARYEQSYGALPPQVENSRAKPGQVKDIYSQLQISAQ